MSEQPKPTIQESNNALFSLIKNEAESCYDLVFKQPSYITSPELLAITSYIHQLGVNHPKEKLRIGAQVEEKKSRIIV